MKKALFIMLLFYLLAGFTFADAANYYIEISLNQCKLLLYAKDPDGSKILVQEYDVATVKKNKRIFPFGLGKITKIEIDPWWYPTNDSRKEFAKRGISLGSSISPAILLIIWVNSRFIFRTKPARDRFTGFTEPRKVRIIKSDSG